MPQKSFEFTREELYEQVWSLPVTKLASKHGITSYDVTKAAKKLGVPLPPSGHWTLVAHGKAKPRPSLPSGDFPESYRNAAKVPFGSADVLERFNQELEQHPVEAAPLPPMAQSLDASLPIVKKMAARLKKERPDNRGWKRVAMLGAFEIAVSPDNEERALLTMDRVLKLCQQSDLKWISDPENRDPAYFDLEGTKLTLRIFESAKQHERELTLEEKVKRKANPNGYLYLPDRYIYEPTGKIKLEGMLLTRGRPEFSLVDGSSIPLHERIADVPSKLMETALLQKAQRDHWAEQSRRSEERQRALYAKAEVKRSLLAKLEAIEKMAVDVERAARLRGLATLLEQAGKAEQSLGSDTYEWIRNAADWLDPLVRKHWPPVDDAGRLD